MRILLAMAMAMAAGAQPLQFEVLKESVLEERLRMAHPKNAERYARLKGLFAESGCRGELLREQAVQSSREPNIVCTVAGTEEPRRKIIVGAHFDSIGGDGIIDNWSGAVLLPSLFEFLKSGQRRHTFEFVAFAGEEKGLLGSRTFLNSMDRKDRERIAAVVTMDSLGLTPLKCWVKGSDRELINAGALLAASMRLEFTGVDVQKGATTDSEPFHDARIPVLSLHSVTPEKMKIINGKKDVWAAVSWKDYYDTHRFISALLVYLDRNLP